MTRLVRITGFLLIGAGALVLLTWAIRLLRAIWPLLLGLPLAIQIGMGIAALGLVVVMGALIAERIEDREADRRLLEDRPESSRSQ